MLLVDLDPLTAAHLAAALKAHREACRRQHWAVPRALRDVQDAAFRASKGTDGQPVDVPELDLDSGLMKTALLLDTAEVGARLSLSDRQVKQLIASGELRSVKIHGARRVALDDLEEFVDRLRAEADDAPTAGAA